MFPVSGCTKETGTRNEGTTLAGVIDGEDEPETDRNDGEKHKEGTGGLTRGFVGGVYEENGVPGKNSGDGGNGTPRGGRDMEHGNKGVEKLEGGVEKTRGTEEGTEEDVPEALSLVMLRAGRFPGHLHVPHHEWPGRAHGRE